MPTQFEDKIGSTPPANQPTNPPPYYNYSYYPPQTHQITAGNIVFWIFYVLIGFWVDLALTLTFWSLAVILPLTFPFVVAIGGNEGLFNRQGIVLVPGDLFYGQTDSMIYAEAALISLFGVMLLVAAILTLKPWFRFHLAMFRNLGGLPV